MKYSEADNLLDSIQKQNIHELYKFYHAYLYNSELIFVKNGNFDYTEFEIKYPKIAELFKSASLIEKIKYILSSSKKTFKIDELNKRIEFMRGYLRGLSLAINDKNYAIKLRENHKIAETAKVLKCEKISEFATISDIGSFIIDDVYYSNFYGDGDNRVKIVKVENRKDFLRAPYVSNREIYNPNERFLKVEFAKQKNIKVNICDCDESFGKREIKNAIGFCVWAKTLKIFVCNSEK